jgi:hypothetical protein
MGSLIIALTSERKSAYPYALGCGIARGWESEREKIIDGT